MPDQDPEFEKRHLANLRRNERQIRKLYEDAIHEIAPGLNSIALRGQVFQLKDYPALLARIKAQVKKLHAGVYAATVNGIEESWGLSHSKNNIFVDRRLAGATASARAKQILYDPNIEGLNAFIRRKEGGMNLSDRIWKSLDGYRTEMETVIGVGVSEGKDADSMARELKRFLNEPDRVFRRIRQDDGTLKLSRAAREYHPGQGVYRSSHLNAKRVARSETNMAYRNADIERWRTLPFVKAFRIHLSANHPKYDICDSLAGVYPLTFNWASWHPQCLCYVTAEQISDAEYEKYEDSILGIGKAPEIKKVEKMPAAFIKYAQENADRIAGWKSKPYWVKDNPGILKR